ncbi:MAG: helix-hairpin-helix domain-containing protein [Candidatus Paceibacterota bacterium]
MPKFLILIALVGVSFAPASAYAALVNINTADAALLDTLPGIGPSKATAIIEYRTAHGLFARIEDLQNVTGIGAATFADLQALITVGAHEAPPEEPAPESVTAPVATTSPKATSGASSSKPRPRELVVTIVGDAHASVDVPLALSALVKTPEGKDDPDARVTWGFGDGSSAEGLRAEKTYRYEGTYLVVAEATDGATVGRAELAVTAEPARVRIALVTKDGIVIVNDTNEKVDLSGWALYAHPKSFRIPRGTVILPGARVVFTYATTRLPATFSALLTYPDGAFAAQYPVSAPQPVEEPKPSVFGESSYTKQTIIHSEPLHAPQAVIAPESTSNLGGFGAVPATPEDVAPAAEEIEGNGVLSSPWFLGFLGVVMLAGGAVMIL